MNNKVISESGDTYIKFDDGTLLCFGFSGIIENNSNKTITYPTPFKFAPYIALGQQNGDVHAFYYNQIAVYDNSATQLTLTNRRFLSEYNYALHTGWIAIGKWK